MRRINRGEKEDCLKVITQVIDSLIVETAQQFDAKNNTKKQPIPKG